MTLQPFKIISRAAIVVASIILTACATTTAGNDVEQRSQNTPSLVGKDASWSLRLPEDEMVFYRGVVNSDGAGGGTTGSMLYPAPNVGGFVAAVITHGIINQTAKNSRKNSLQEAADKVLLPYQPVLAHYSHKELMQKGLEKMSTGGNKKLTGFSEKPGIGWRVESMPVYSMTQDQSAIILENAISIYGPDANSAAVFQKNVRVVSRPQSGTNLMSFWTADNGKNLKEASAGLFAESMDIALDDVANSSTSSNNAAFKTFRYLEGGTERMERGQLIRENCGRIVIRTLRGEPMSIPTRGDAAATPAAGQCRQVSSNLK